MKSNSENARIMHDYLRHLRGPCGYSESTIRAKEHAVCSYEDFTKYEGFDKFNQSKAEGFKRWLENRQSKGKKLSVTSVYHHLRHLKDFFKWLSGRSGYRSKISADAISYLTLEKNKVREALAPKYVKHPTLDHIKQVVSSIKIVTEIDRRDRALISFLLLSGMRDSAIATLPLGCFDIDTLQILQDPRQGVATKFNKLIVSTLFRFDDDLVAEVIDWAKYLQSQKGFSPDDPLFPKSKTVQADDGFTFVSTEVEPVFWETTNGIRAILKKRSEEAGLEYYHPHSFRHAAVRLAFKHCRSGEELKAISQNLGHEFVRTTIEQYGRLEPDRVGEVISNLNFKGDSGPGQGIPREDLEKFLQGYQK